MYQISVMAGLALGGLAMFLLAFAWARRGRARALIKAERRAGADAAAPEPMVRRVELRLDEIEARLEARIEALTAAGSPEDRLQAMAGSLVGLIRDKNATLETALAGLDQLRARLRALEQMGDLAEARRLFERLEARIDEIRTTQAAAAAAVEERIAGLKSQADAAPRVAPLAAPLAAVTEQFSRLYAQKDAGVAAMLARLAPVETRLAELEADRGTQDAVREAQARLEARLEALREVQDAGQRDLAALKAEVAAGAGPVTAIAERLGGLHAQKEALAETLIARLAALEEALAGRDPQAALDRFAERLEAVQGRLSVLETPGENPFAAISEQLTRLYAQKDATVETVFARLAPLEARLGEVEAGLLSRDPQAALDRFAERLEAAQAARAAAEAALGDRVAALEAPGENPFAAISEQLTRLYAQKDATVETVFARLAPLEARLAEMEEGLAARDPRAALDAFAERLEAAQAARAAAEAALGDRVAALEAPGENPFAAISEQLTRLYAQKDATVETVFARLAPLEARLGDIEAGFAARDPQAALDRFAERLEAVQGRLSLLEAPGESPFAAISEQLTRLYAQKDATVETVFARLAPLEARLVEVEAGFAARDPQAALDRFAERLEAAQAARAAAEAALGDRVAALEAPGENPFAAISEQLTRLYAQKDATVETVFARLAPLEARLAGIEQGVAQSLPRLAALEAEDPRAALNDLAVDLGARMEALCDEQGAAAVRIEALRETLGDAVAALPFAAIADQLTRLYAQKDASVAAVTARLAPLEARLAELEARPSDADAEAARAEAQAIATQMIAARAAAEQTELFANRLALLEVSLPRLTAAQAEMTRALERQAAPEPLAEPAPVPEPVAEVVAEVVQEVVPELVADTGPAVRDARAADLDAIRDMPRVVSLHHK